MKLLRFVTACSAIPNQTLTENQIDYSGYKVLIANWTDSSISSDVENVLLATNADLWSSRADIYENNFMRFMIPGNLAPELTSLLRKGF